MAICRLIECEYVFPTSPRNVQICFSIRNVSQKLLRQSMQPIGTFAPVLLTTSRTAYTYCSHTSHRSIQVLLACLTSIDTGATRIHHLVLIWRACVPRGEIINQRKVLDTDADKDLLGSIIHAAYYAPTGNKTFWARNRVNSHTFTCFLGPRRKARNHRSHRHKYVARNTRLLDCSCLCSHVSPPDQ